MPLSSFPVLTGNERYAIAWEKETSSTTLCCNARIPDNGRDTRAVEEERITSYSQDANIVYTR
jgi:hypothetical protein